MTYLGIDVGTSGVKAFLIDRAGKALGEANAKAVEPVRPHPGWSEQQPSDWWSATLEAVDKLSKAHPEELAKAGVSEDLVRISVGIEHIDDIIADVDQALASVG